MESDIEKERKELKELETTLKKQVRRYAEEQWVGNENRPTIVPSFLFRSHKNTSIFNLNAHHVFLLNKQLHHATLVRHSMALHTRAASAILIDTVKTVRTLKKTPEGNHRAVGARLQ